MNHNSHFNRAKRLAMTGVTLTVCGAVLALHQAQVQAATDMQQPVATDNESNVTTENSEGNAINVQPQQPAAVATQTASAAAQQTANTDRGNYGSLDQVNLSGGQLQLSGWNANGAADNRPYHKIIVLDQSGHELGRTDAVASQRPDVAASYANTPGALNSGWSANFQINSTDWFNQPLRIVSRYSMTADANNSDADFWYAPVTINNRNEGNLDSWSLADGHLQASGWNATNASYQDRSHWMIIFDKTQGRELTRVKVTPIKRQDVANAYSTIYNSQNAGWQIDYNFGNDSRFLNDQLQLISRYSSDAQNGEGSHTDFWYSPIQADHRNQASLDVAAISGNQLHVAGWHATSGEMGRGNHYIIILDANNHEITRQKVTNLSRPDVGRAYSELYNADNSGWSADFDLKPAMVEGPIRIVSRYSGATDGNSNNVDYWFNPVTFNHNYAQITGVSSANGQITITGYHAADVAYGEPNHFLILFDNTTNRQVAAVKTTASETPASAKGLNAYNAANSGFTATLNVPNGLNSGHQYSLVLRYSADPNDNGNNAAHSDTWLTLNRANVANLDGVDLSTGNLVVSGWHANDFSVVAPYHYLIVYDNTTHQQVAAQLVNSQVQREDVAKAYPAIITAADSGFNANLGKVNLQPNHSYSIVSRYSNSAQGNGNNGAYQDQWMGPVSFNQTAGFVDSFTQTATGFHVNGWLASDQLLVKHHPYVIILDNGREIGRAAINQFSQRSDVANSYHQVYNSANSGFSVDVSTNVRPATLTDGQLSFILRVTDDPAGNGNATDLRMGNYPINTGKINLSFDRANNTINVNGWHASMADASRPYQFLIVLGADGHEFYRRALNSTNSNQAVSDGAAYIANGRQSGFGMTLPVTDAMNHWGIKVLHRYSSDVNGNSDYIDFVSPEIGINDGFQHLNGGTVYYDPTTGHRATGWRTVNGNRYYFSDGYENQPMPDDLWVYNDQLKGQMYTGVNYVDGHCYDFGNDGVARAQPQNDGWSWPFPAAGRGSFAPGQAFGYSGYKRTSEYPGNDRRNYYHDGLDFGAYDHPGSEVHAVHGAKVLDVNTCRNSKGETMWWYIIAWDGRYLYVYQEAFQTRAQIAVNPGQIIYPGQVIGWRNTSHLHLGINTSPNYGMDLAHSFQPSWSDASAATGSGTWLDPQWVISHGGN